MVLHHGPLLEIFCPIQVVPVCPSEVTCKISVILLLGRFIVCPILRVSYSLNNVIPDDYQRTTTSSRREAAWVVEQGCTYGYHEVTHDNISDECSVAIQWIGEGLSIVEVQGVVKQADVYHGSIWCDSTV